MSTAEETMLHIFKRRMGLTKRGSYDDEGLTVSDVSVNQTDNFTVHETSEFVTLTIPTTQILETKVGAETTVSTPTFSNPDLFIMMVHLMSYRLVSF